MSLDVRLQRMLDGAAEPNPMRRHQLFLTGATDARLRALLSEPARAALASGDLLSVVDELKIEAEQAGARDRWDTLQLYYLRTYLAAGVLQKVDRASMFASLEVRAPLLDRHVVDLALALPLVDKMQGFTTKVLLKRVAAELLPENIVHRRKQGFGVPLAQWLCGPLRPLVGDLLSPQALREDGYLDPARVGTLVDEHLSKRRNHQKLLFSALMYRLWRSRATA
jgi:asparagine synthase (glutamine-hydrolysing)